MDVGGVGGNEGPEEQEDFAGAVGRGVEQSRARHVKGILQAWVSLWFLISEGLEFTNVVVWVARHIADADRKAVAHADNTKLGNGVLLEELDDEFLAVAEGEEVARWAEIFFGHGRGEVDDED